MPYRAPIADQKFILDQVIDHAEITATARFADAGGDVARAILDEAARLVETEIAPLNRNGDRVPARLDGDRVITSPGFAEGHAAIARGGWIGAAADPAHGGMGLPLTLVSCVNEMLAGACLSLQLLPLLTQGQIATIERHAPEWIRALYLPRLISGEWAGVMDLTEPGAGSDVGALRTRAEPRDDGTHAITGEKIFITWGDSDLVANTCHLVLARLPDAPAGSHGLSLFLVPRFLPDDAGRPGARNAVRTVRLEEKLGIHGSPTCEMRFDGATGWLIGGANEGMALMFTMMNNARLGVGLQGVGVGEAALQKAAAHAAERVQGRTPAGAPDTIIGHPDIRRMLAEARAHVFAARAICLACAKAIDMAQATESAAWAARAGLLTPIAKAYGTTTGIRAADIGIQVHGGMGYIEETGAAQYLRDARITSIYEGTNGIQAIDLVMRKLRDDGAAAMALLDEIRTGAERAAGGSDLARPVIATTVALRDATRAITAMPATDRLAAAPSYLRAFALTLGGGFHLRAATRDEARRPLARVMIERLLPEADYLLGLTHCGAAMLNDIRDETLLG